MTDSPSVILILETIRISICDRLEGYLGIGQALNFNGSTDLTTTTASTPSSPLGAVNNTLATPVGTPNSGGTPVATTPSVFEPLYAPAVTPDDEFCDLSKRLFLSYYDIYQNTVRTESEQVKDGTVFYKAQFEFGGNKMDGTFNYASLAKRLEAIKTAIDKETNDWATESSSWISHLNSISGNLKRQFEQVREYYNESNTGVVDIELTDDNPFLWNFTLFGKPMRYLSFVLCFCL
jgi:ubiquitin-conjugating enzyme E2 Z